MNLLTELLALSKGWGSMDAIELDEIVIDMKTRKEVKPADVKKLTMLQAFGSHELNVLNDAGIKLMEKPSYWEEFDDPEEKKYVHSQFSIARAEKELGGKFKVYSSEEIYGGSKPRGPLAKVNHMPDEYMFIIDFGDDDKYLVDRTGASTYIRNWAKIK